MDLLDDAFVKWVKFKIMTASLGKPKSTVSEQITKAVRLYDQWAGGLGKGIVTEMMLRAEQQEGAVEEPETLDPSERKVTPKDKVLSELKLQVAVLQKQDNEAVRQQKLEEAIEREEEKIAELKGTDLMRKATKGSEAFIDFALRYVIPKNSNLEEDIKKYSPEKNVEQFVKRFLKDKKLRMEEVMAEKEEYGEDEDDVLSDVGAAYYVVYNILNEELDDLKYEDAVQKKNNLLREHNGSAVTPFCPRKDEGVECQIILEYDPSHLGDLHCPKHSNGTHYYCFVCQGMGKEKTKLEWNIVDKRFVCPVCECYNPIDFDLMEVGITQRVRDIALEKAKNQGCDEKEANEYADEVAYIKWGDRHKEPVTVPLPHEEPELTSPLSDLPLETLDCPVCGEKLVHIGKHLFSCPKCPTPIGMRCPNCNDKRPLKYGARNNILFCNKCNYKIRLPNKNTLVPASIIVDGVTIPFRFTNPSARQDD